MGAAQETRESQIPRVNKEAEQKLPPAFRGIAYAIVFSAEDISGYHLSPEQKSKLKKIEERFVELAPKFFRIARRAVAVGAIIAIGNYYQTHPDLNKTTDEAGQTIYTHEDARTTHYLNILAGKEKYTEKDLEAEIKPDIISKLKEKKVAIPINIEEMSLDEVYNLYYENSDPSKIEKPQDFIIYNAQRIQEINYRNAFKYSVSNGGEYGSVWQLEEECGNPRIRFVKEGQLTLASGKFKDADKYDPFSNTMFITSDSFFYPRKGFSDETSHAEQFFSNQLGSYVKATRDFVIVTIVGRFDLSRIEAEYDLLYERPGSLEHEAHKIIQPDLQKKYPLP